MTNIQNLANNGNSSKREVDLERLSELVQKLQNATENLENVTAKLTKNFKSLISDISTCERLRMELD